MPIYSSNAESNVTGDGRIGAASPSQMTSFAGSSLRACLQCGKCTAGCPMRGFMEQPPNRTIRLLQLGEGEQVLGGRSIWYCASCETCTTRCPNGVDPAAVMDALRQLWWRRRGSSEEKSVQLANRLFLENIRSFGRQHELRLGALDDAVDKIGIKN